jgi:CRISPR-associated protein Cst2
MSQVTGILLIDAPASALNNAQKDEDVKNLANAVAVKFIETPQGRYPYVSAQATRAWLRRQITATDSAWGTPIHREEKVAYTAADPVAFAEDDLMGYMRAPDGMESEKAARAAGLAPLEEGKKNGKVVPISITRISPFRVGTLVSTVPIRIRRDFGTMARGEGDPVPFTHQFYRAHLKAPLALDLTCAGTFFVSKRVGYKNLDKNRQESAKQAGATDAKVRGFDALRLPLATRQQRVSQLVAALGRLEGGAKQTLHLTDTAPSILILAVCKSGNQPFMRAIGPDEAEEGTVFRPDVLEQALTVFKDDIVSDLYVGWAKGFLDPERKKLEGMIRDGKVHGRTIHIKHPREIADELAQALKDSANAAWFE